MFYAVLEGTACVIKTNGTLNPPTDTDYMINVTVSGGGRNETVGVVITFVTFFSYIYLSDSVPGPDNSVPVFDPASYTVFVAYNEPLGSVVVRLVS